MVRPMSSLGSGEDERDVIALCSNLKTTDISDVAGLEGESWGEQVCLKVENKD